MNTRLIEEVLLKSRIEKYASQVIGEKPELNMLLSVLKEYNNQIKMLHEVSGNSALEETLWYFLFKKNIPIGKELSEKVEHLKNSTDVQNAFFNHIASESLSRTYSANPNKQQHVRSLLRNKINERGILQLKMEKALKADNINEAVSEAVISNSLNKRTFVPQELSNIVGGFLDDSSVIELSKVNLEASKAINSK